MSSSPSSSSYSSSNVRQSSSWKSGPSSKQKPDDQTINSSPSAQSSSLSRSTIRDEAINKLNEDSSKVPVPSSSGSGNNRAVGSVTTPRDNPSKTDQSTNKVSTRASSMAKPSTPSSQRQPEATKEPLASPKVPKKKRKRRKQKESKEVINISLYIDGVPYDYGIICTFCTIRPAVKHCSRCNDFYCEIDDAINHAHKKRHDHVRSIISKLSLDDAAGIITRAFRLNYHLKILQKRAKKVFHRYFDKESLNHYYYNTVYGTSSWKKPYCLRKKELTPFFTQDYAAMKMQGLYHMWKARDHTKQLLNANYRKIFDRRQGDFYYAFHGKSTFIPQSSWKKPRYCYRRSYPRDMPLIYTPDVAALIIQRKWRATLVRELWRLLARITYELIWDPINARWNYYDREKGILLDQQLRLMRQQPWDPYDVSEWSIGRVSLFLRRIDLKHHVESFIDYGVDGKTLLMLGKEDYDNMNVTNRVDVRKIEVELMKIYPYEKKLRVTEDIFLRRERVKKMKLFNASALKIQRCFRGHLARDDVKLSKEVTRMRLRLKQQDEETLLSGIWYTDRQDIPSKRYIGDHILSDEANFDQWKVILTPEDLKLPPIPVKSFGRKRDHLSTKGWGRRGPQDEWIDLSVVRKGLPPVNEAHPTRIFTEKLSVSGYDRRRYQKFAGLPVDRFEFTVDKDKRVTEPELLL